MKFRKTKSSLKAFQKLQVEQVAKLGGRLSEIPKDVMDIKSSLKAIQNHQAKQAVKLGEEICSDLPSVFIKRAKNSFRLFIVKTTNNFKNLFLFSNIFFETNFWFVL